MEKADRKTAREVFEYRLTKPDHPSSGEKNGLGTVFLSGGRAERMNRTIREARGERFHHDPNDQLRRQLAAVMAAENFARRLKTLEGHATRRDLQDPDFRAGQIPPRHDPPDAGLRHLTGDMRCVIATIFRTRPQTLHVPPGIAP
ncbi:hypothetical protein [Rhodovulum sulfidophilum]|uniref:hypothetical protein n=1 Tax=Rhodovulum sulfidophilum TaxID=35806 RepID=UPI001F273162|nr:hypothetical protein [Rhodovulum sulfidophilum]